VQETQVVGSPAALNASLNVIGITSTARLLKKAALDPESPRNVSLDLNAYSKWTKQ